MLNKDTISIHLVREALLQSCAPGKAMDEVLHKVGIDPQLLGQPQARVPAVVYARLWRLLARRLDDEFFGMDPRKLRHGSLAFMSRAAMVQPITGGASGQIADYQDPVAPGTYYYWVRAANISGVEGPAAGPAEITIT